jgi:hypothetical protein
MRKIVFMLLALFVVFLVSCKTEVKTEELEEGLTEEVVDVEVETEEVEEVEEVEE